MVVTMSLPSIIMVHLRPSVAKVLGCCAKTSSVFVIMSGLLLPTRFVTHHGTKTMTFNMGHTPYSRDLVPHNFHLLGPLKKYRAGKWFAIDASTKQAVTSWLQAVDSVFCYKSQNMWRSDTYCLLPMCHLYIKMSLKFLASECLLPYFFKILCIIIITTLLYY